MWVRLILENSTVCLISRRISLFCPVDVNVCSSVWPFGVGWLGGWCRGFFDNDSEQLFRQLMSVSFFVMDVALIDCGWPGFGWVGPYFSMESLILAQDERWRRA